LLRRHTLIVTATTAPHYILKTDYQELLSGKILIDLAFPRNIDPDLGLSGDSRLWDLEYFGEISKVNRKNKVEAIAAAKNQCLSALERIKKKSARQPVETNFVKLIG
jgi:glutamyl-tRNA reductase